MAPASSSPFGLGVVSRHGGGCSPIRIWKVGPIVGDRPLIVFDGPLITGEAKLGIGDVEIP
jgi:hypothetical protein